MHPPTYPPKRNLILRMAPRRSLRDLIRRRYAQAASTIPARFGQTIDPLQFLSEPPDATIRDDDCHRIH
jgi:hypothetical protein